MDKSEKSHDEKNWNKNIYRNVYLLVDKMFSDVMPKRPGLIL